MYSRLQLNLRSSNGGVYLGTWVLPDLLVFRVYRYDEEAWIFAFITA